MAVRNIVPFFMGRHQELKQVAKTRKLKWFGHATRGAGLAKTCHQSLSMEAEAEDGRAASQKVE